MIAAVAAAAAVQSAIAVCALNGYDKSYDIGGRSNCSGIAVAVRTLVARVVREKECYYVRLL
jgi:hypothetical protein